jgi:hypothetical protein
MYPASSILRMMMSESASVMVVDTRACVTAESSTCCAVHVCVAKLKVWCGTLRARIW